MIFRTRVAALAMACLLVGEAHPDSAVRDELNGYAVPVARYIEMYYIDQVPPDTLMEAAVQGLFEALDPGSEFSFEGQGDDWKANFNIFEAIARQVDRKALYAVGADTLIRFGIGGMMSVLDPDTVFMERLNLENFRIDVRGEYGGLGFRIQVIRPDSAIAVWSLLHEKTPAARAGVKSGDIILAIDDSATTHMSAGDAAGLMRGEVDTPVTLTLARAGELEPIDITIVRKKVHVDGVPYYTMFADSTGYIKLLKFQQNSSEEVEAALDDLLSRGAKRLILDLRGNGGGLLTEAVEIADLFLPKNHLVVYTAGRAFKDTTKYLTTRRPKFPDGPLVVMVDRGSASASEIVSGAVQDWDRGLVLGHPTVGKGSVQKTIAIGERAELKLTMAAYFIPSGRSIDKRMRKDSTLLALSDKEFRTRNRGRIVRGAGGITPDIGGTSRKRTPLYAQLEGWRTLNSQFFHFARAYGASHSELASDFVADHDVFKEFRELADSREFSYVSGVEQRLLQLEQEVTREKEQGKLAKPLKKLKKGIDKIEEKHWETNEELITWKLTFDILEKSFGMKAAYAYDVTVDPQVLTAREVVSDPELYESYFSRLQIGLTNDEFMAATTDTSGMQAGDGMR